MIKNAFAYVTRKSLKSIIILLVIMAMSTLSLISLAIKDATNRASEETFKNITNSFWDWFIQSFKWKIDDTEIEKTADLLNLETSWQIVHKFKNYWKQIIKLQIINSNWKSVEISKEVNIKKQINLVNKIEFSLIWTFKSLFLGKKI